MMLGKPGGRIHRPSPYPGFLLDLLDRLSTSMMALCRSYLDKIISSFIPITEEWKHPALYCIGTAFKLPWLISAFFLTLPVGIFGLVVYTLIADKRQKFRLSIADTIDDRPVPKKTYGFSTINMCGHYECVSRLNNLKDTFHRVKEMGKIISKSQARYITESLQNGKPDSSSNGSTRGRVTVLVEGTDVEIKTDFPETDVILLQEVMFPEYGQALANILQTVYPYAVYDACDHGWTKNCMLSGGDVMLLSKYPILNARFQRFSARCGYDVAASKGLIQAKLDLGDAGGYKLVGYVANTHLQVYQEDPSIRTRQFDDMEYWTKEYRQKTIKPGEKIVFDIIGGDFNFDVTSPVDKQDWDHSIFTVYNDVCRDGPGKNKSFAVGTEVRQPTMHEPQVSTPQGLKAALEDPSLRRRHVLDGDIDGIDLGSVWVLPPADPQTGRIVATPLGGKRRVDYLMTRAEDDVKTIAANAVTQLANLTDHIPFNITIQVS